VRIYQTATALGVLIKVYLLQGSVDLQRGVQGSYNKMRLTRSVSACEGIGIKVVDTQVKDKKIPVPLLYQRIKVEPDEVSYFFFFFFFFVFVIRPFHGFVVIKK
jgi:hypothetical protein